MSPADKAKRAALDRLWGNVEAALDDEVVHQKFVRFAVDGELYLPAIERYKALAQRDPRYAPVADKWQKAIAGQAAAKVLLRAPRETRPSPRRGRQILVVLMLAGLFAWILRYGCAPSPPSSALDGPPASREASRDGRSQALA